MQQSLILIDGPKGSGKSTLAHALQQSFPDTECLSLDAERKILERTDSIDMDNERAFQIILQKLASNFDQGKSVILDSGLSTARILTLENLAKEHSVRVCKFSLIAPYDVLMARVKARDMASGKVFNQERFDYTYNVNQAKSFDNFCVLDSSTLSPQEILAAIQAKLQ